METSNYWQIDIPKGYTLNQAIADAKKLFPVYSYYDDLDNEVTQNDRTSKKAYSVWVKANVEADEENKNISAEDFKGNGITLLERIVLEIQYFKETGKHLDRENITLCTGSRHSGGGVPRADWRGSGLCVRWCAVADRAPSLRSRSVFVSNPSTLGPLESSLETSPTHPDIEIIEQVRRASRIKWETHINSVLDGVEDETPLMMKNSKTGDYSCVSCGIRISEIRKALVFTPEIGDSQK